MPVFSVAHPYAGVDEAWIPPIPAEEFELASDVSNEDFLELKEEMECAKEPEAGV